RDRLLPGSEPGASVGKDILAAAASVPAMSLPGLLTCGIAAWRSPSTLLANPQGLRCHSQVASRKEMTEDQRTAAKKGDGGDAPARYWCGPATDNRLIPSPTAADLEDCPAPVFLLKGHCDARPSQRVYPHLPDRVLGRARDSVRLGPGAPGARTTTEPARA